MQNIRIGKGPDYCMMRGLEIVNYRIILSVSAENQGFGMRTIVDGSLFMLVKKLRQHIPQSLRSLKPKIGTEMMPNPTFTLNYLVQGGRFRVLFFLPSDLVESQVVKLINIFEDLLRLYL